MTTSVYLRTAMVVYCLSIVSKLLSIVIEPERLVAAHGLLMFLSRRQFLFVAAVFEAAVLLLLFARRIPSSTKVYIVYSAAVFFSSYHVWMMMKGVSGCGCFGIFPFKALNRALDYFTYGILLVLLVGGGLIIGREGLTANGSFGKN